VDFDEEDWENVSDNAKDLVLKLLIKDPKQRMTCTEALQHPFFNILQKKSKKDKAPVLQTLTRLSRFKAPKRFRTEATKVAMKYIT
jgi:calcium-dependent protein kinase